MYILILELKMCGHWHHSPVSSQTCIIIYAVQLEPNLVLIGYGQIFQSITRNNNSFTIGRRDGNLGKEKTGALGNIDWNLKSEILWLVMKRIKKKHIYQLLQQIDLRKWNTANPYPTESVSPLMFRKKRKESEIKSTAEKGWRMEEKVLRSLHYWLSCLPTVY